MNEIKNTWTRVGQRLRKSWRPILLTHLGFTAIRIIIFVPLLGLIGRLLLRLSGQSVLADQDIAHFLLSPVGLLALILFSSLLITVLVFEQAAIMHLAQSGMRGKSIGAFEALRLTTMRLQALWLYTARLVIRVLILALPLLAVAALVAWYLITDYDINYYLSEKPREFWIATTLIGILLIVLLWVLLHKLLQWALSLPLVLFSATAPADSFTLSTNILTGRRKPVFLLLASWAGLTLLLSLLVLGAIKLPGQLLLPHVSGSLDLTLFLLGGLLIVWAVANVLLSAFTSSAFAYLLMDLYARHEKVHRLEPSQHGTAGQTPVTLKFSAKTLVASVVACAIVAAMAGVWMLNSVPVNNEVIIAAHRGAAGKAPENTLASIQQALDDKTDWVEIDVQENADGNIVVMHDSDFMKLAGNPLKIWDASSSQLQEIDIGSWYDPVFSGERVPSLLEVIDLVRGKAKLVIELKYYGHDKNLEQGVIDIVEQAGVVDEIAIMSLKYAGIQKVRALRPEWTVGLLSATAIGDLNSLDTDFLAVAMGMVSSGLINRAHQAGRKVFVWTVNDPVSLSRMISLDVDGIITDEPEMARRVMAEHAQMNTVQRLLLHIALLFGDPQPPQQYRDTSP